MSELRWEDWVRGEDDPRGAFAKPEALADLLVVDVSRESVAAMACTAAELGLSVTACSSNANGDCASSPAIRKAMAACARLSASLAFNDRTARAWTSAASRSAGCAPLH